MDACHPPAGTHSTIEGMEPPGTRIVPLNRNWLTYRRDEPPDAI